MCDESPTRRSMIDTPTGQAALAAIKQYTADQATAAPKPLQPMILSRRAARMLARAQKKAGK